jgi:hypothetical protein
MRVTIEHRENAGGVTGATKHHFVDCTVAFSEEEKAIIKARGLHDHSFTVGPATPIASGAAYIGSGALNSLGRLGVVGGFVLGVFSSAIGGSAGLIAGWCVFLGAGLWIYAAVVMRKQEKRLTDPDQVITLKNLLNNGRFTVYASSPLHAQSIEQEIRDSLSYVKQLITAGAEIKPKQTFEL